MQKWKYAMRMLPSMGTQTGFRSFAENIVPRGKPRGTILAPRLGNENSRQFSFLSLYVANKNILKIRAFLFFRVFFPFLHTSAFTEVALPYERLVSPS